MLYLVPRRAPFSDWRAQIERAVERRTGEPFHLEPSAALRGCYDCGLSPVEVADDWAAWTHGKGRQ